MTAPQCAQVRQALGVYVLGAIEPADRDAVDRHLADCADCRQELAGLAGLPALLRRVPAAEISGLAAENTGDRRAEAPSPGPELASALALAGRRRRHRSQALAAAAAAAGLIAGAGATAGLHAVHSAERRPAASAPTWAGTSQATSPRTGVRMIVRYAARRWGLELSVRVAGLPPGTTCELHVITGQEPAATAGGWTLAGDPAAWYPASASVPLTAVRDFVLTSGSRTLVTVPVQVSTHSPAARGFW